MQRRNTIKCPECDGKGVFKIQTSQYWEEPVRHRVETCGLCKGACHISALAHAIYVARGTLAPPIIQTR